MKDLVTVFTPVYNRKNLIGNLYQSLLSQTYKNFEWIIVDDGSTDDIDEIIKSYQNEDRILIRFIKQENGGKHRAINNGVLHAKGELFYIVDSDDYLTKGSTITNLSSRSHKNHLVAQVNTLCGMCYHDDCLAFTL